MTNPGGGYPPFGEPGNDPYGQPPQQPPFGNAPYPAQPPPYTSQPEPGSETKPYPATGAPYGGGTAQYPQYPQQPPSGPPFSTEGGYGAFGQQQPRQNPYWQQPPNQPGGPYMPQTPFGPHGPKKSNTGVMAAVAIVAVLVVVGATVGIFLATKSDKKGDDKAGGSGNTNLVSAEESAKTALTRFLDASKKGDASAARKVVCAKLRTTITHDVDGEPNATYKITSSKKISSTKYTFTVHIKVPGESPATVTFDVTKEGSQWGVCNVGLPDRDLSSDDPESDLSDLDTDFDYSSDDFDNYESDFDSSYDTYGYERDGTTVR